MSWAFPELTERNTSARISRPRETERNLQLTPATQFAYAYMIVGSGGLVTKHRAVHCGVHSTGCHPMLQPQQQTLQSLGRRISLFECLGIGLLGCFGQGRIQWILFSTVLNFYFSCSCMPFTLALLDLPYISPKHFNSGSQSVFFLENRDDTTCHLTKLRA